MNRGWSYRDYVRDEASGLSISGFYSQNYSHSDITCWRRRLSGGEIEHNGLRTRDDLLLAVGLDAGRLGRHVRGVAYAA